MGGTKRPRTKSLTLNPATPKRPKKQLSTFTFLSGQNDGYNPPQPALPPIRKHASSYHRPALLDHVDSQVALLSWFESVSKDRDMPWRQKWINPVTFEKLNNADPSLDLQETLKRRAYQVWISEIMLQQTRVETVRAYYTSWHTRWPTIEDLAAASPPEVLSAWKGLGYYSRATRIHTAAKLIVEDDAMKGMLPELPAELESRVPGVGPYTAGAISSIVFGHAVPILDGNVMRVLCRQMGLFANMKSKVTTDLLWEAADRLVKDVTRNALAKEGVEVEEEEVPKSEIPSFWNQALMELGSTLCKPVKPDCGICPVKETCLAYAEGERLAQKKGFLNIKKSSSVFEGTSNTKLIDIEDICTFCEPMEEIILDEDLEQADATPKGRTKSSKAIPPPKPGLKQATLSFGQKAKPVLKTADTSDNHQTKATSTIEKYVSLFPQKVIKKSVRNEECVVCIIKRTGSENKEEWLIEQRPDKGLLASLWQFPSLTVYTDEGKAGADEEGSEGEEDEDDELPVKPGGKLKAKPKAAAKTKTSTTLSDPPSAKERKKSAVEFVESILRKSYDADDKKGTKSIGKVEHIAEYGSITHLFSHIRLVMHVHYFEWDTVTEGIPKATNEISSKNLSKQAEYQQRRWAAREEVEEESFGTGMRKCWTLALGGNTSL